MNSTNKVSFLGIKRNILLLFFVLQFSSLHFATGVYPTYAKNSSVNFYITQAKISQLNSNQLFSISSLFMMADTDGDGVLDEFDIDDDNDGIPDTYEYCNANNFNCSGEPSNPSADNDFDGIPNYIDANSPNTGCTDDNNDGVCDILFSIYDKDGDNVADHLDLDGDNDGISDLYEVGHGAPDTNGDGVIDGAPADFGANGLYNLISNNPDDFSADINYIIRDSDNDDIPDHDDLDVDHDGASDIAEAYEADLDLNNDGKIDDDGNTPSVGATGIPIFQDPAFTGVPMEAPRDSDGDGIEDYRDLDSDNDGISDVIENNFNNDPDNDGMLGAAWEPANSNGFPVSGLTGTFQTSTSALNDLDGDGFYAYIDLDSDNDGINDIKEGTFFQDPDNNGLVGTGIPTVDDKGRANEFHSSFEDKDADGYPNFLDLDSDNDGVNDVLEAGFTDGNNDGFIGHSGLIVNSFGQAISDNLGSSLATSSTVWELDIDYIVNYLELDSDNDGINDVAEAGLPDPDNDGHVGQAPIMLNEFGQIINNLTNTAYATSTPKDFDGDGFPDMFEYDSDNDGIPDTVDSEIPDPDNNGIVGVGTPSINSWGQPITDNLGNAFSNTSLPLDTDGDGFPNYNDLDSDGDELTDSEECPNLPCTDFENDGVPEFLDIDCNVFLADPIIITDPVVCVDDIITLSLLEVHPSWTSINSNVTYTWKNGLGEVIGNSVNAVSIAASNTLAVPPYTFEVELTNCTSSISQQTDVDIKEIPLPVASSTGFICPGSNATLSAAPIPGATYQWRIQGNSNIFSTAQNPVVFNVMENTVYELTIISDGCASDEPAATSLQLYTPPSAQPDYNYAINSLDCSPLSISLFSNFGQGSAPITNASWIGPAGFFSNELDPVINNPSSANNGSYVVTGTDENGCSVTRSFQINEIVESPQEPEITSLGNNCEGSLISLLATNYIGSNVTYIWQAPNGETSGISGQNSNILAISPYDPTIHTGVYTVEVLLDGCSMTDVFELLPAQQPAVNPTIESGMICEGDVVQFFANGINTSNIVSYQWAGPNGFSSNNENPKLFDAEISDNGCYSVTVTNSNGCSSSEEVCVSNIQQKPITPNTSNNSPVCVGDDITLCTTSAYTGLDIGFVWRNAEGTVIGNGICITISSSDENAISPYNVQVTVDGCISDFSTPITVNSISSLPPMVAFVNSTPCVGESFVISAGTVPGASYEWRTEPNGPVVYTGQNPSVSGIFEPTTFEVIAITTSCLQEPVGEVTVIPEPLPVITAINGTTNLCEGAELILEGTTTGPMNYSWTGPNFSFSSTQATSGPYIANIPSLTLADEGTYTLQLTSPNGCVSNEQSVQVVVLEEPETPIISVNNNQVCFGENILLSANQYVGADVTYEWRFNDGNGIQMIGTSALPFFEISEITEANQGAYTVLVTVDGCASTSSFSENVTVDGLQEPPVAANPTTEMAPLCEGSTIQLTATTEISGASYQWFHPDGNPIPFSTLQNPILQNLTIEDAGEYYVVISFGACPDVTSNLTEVFINETPNPAVLEDIDDICEGSFAEITASNITVDPGSEAQFLWYNATTGILIDSTDDPVLMTDEFTEGNVNVYLIYEVDGCPSTQSATTTFEVSPAPPTNAFAGVDTELCNEVSTFLTASQQTGITGVWTSPTGASTNDPTNPSSEVNSLNEGENVLVWSISNSVCTDFSRDSVIITVNTQPNEMAAAGPDIELCDETTTSLNAADLEVATGVWTQSLEQENAGVVIIDPTSPSSTITGMNEREDYSFIWTLSSGACADYDQDVVVISTGDGITVEAEDDIYTVNTSADLIDIDLIANDNISTNNFTVSVINNNLNGEVDVDGNGVMNYTAPSEFSDAESFTYEICSNTCDEDCATATVTIELLEDEDCFVTAAITPNGDGKNDTFEIPCLVAYPNNELMVFNRWGDKVFEQTSYQGDWDGDRDGLPLPNGTYFYILKFDLDGKKMKQGYFSIIR